MTKQNQSNEECNGWANYETWNVALWINNDRSLYGEAKRYRTRGYSAFVRYMTEAYGDGTFVVTPDGVSWNDPSLDIEALDKMMEEL